ncbi:alpha-glucosidase family protein [Hoeflea prorocentri]|uniref:Alpha-glucosidase family protein n=1 Tax=Hoeflea prorocentri TaxID=1922333 RepID=A0A9X3UI06_9HYPH|nr:alpha-glucosidase family protein [Hoeflea prorocentri]MCY6381024.1 alpha-glucosidase family protein [Hoeflea prorocentri]MDA5398824.1 alpha-glucosidase family protein [Hoeflea prorocentri]
MSEGIVSSSAVDADWWRGAVIYQVYPRSYQDTTGDGTGDLKGITERLPHIASLGVDALWISPFFTSPMRDFGYDVSDYCDVDPMFGTLGDFKALVERAHELGLKVMIDQVLSHSSSEHPWFIESRSSRDNDKADWYVWADAKPDGTPPNNWLSIFGGPAWQWDTGRRQYYLHNFLATQPDLNLHNAEVQDALLEAVRFWLDLGVDGFRLDTINFYFHDRELRNNPPLHPEQRNASIAPDVNPYNFQDHLFDKNQPENLEFLKRLRRLLETFPGSAAVGEVGDAQRGLQIVADYTSGGDKVHMCYSFDLLSETPPTVDHLSTVVRSFEETVKDGWACWAFSNHDVQRHASRWALGFGGTPQHLKLLAAVLLSLRGSVCIYQGEELGLTEADLQFEDLQDPYGIEFWPSFKGRDGCRTPMVWGVEEKHAGFSQAKPWLPVSDEHRSQAVDRQHADPDSVLNHYRGFIAFRKENLPLIKGNFELVSQNDQVFCFRRRFGNETIICAFNMSDETQTVRIADESVETLEGSGFNGHADGQTITIPPIDAYFGLVG